MSKRVFDTLDRMTQNEHRHQRKEYKSERETHPKRATKPAIMNDGKFHCMHCHERKPQAMRKVFPKGLFCTDCLNKSKEKKT